MAEHETATRSKSDIGRLVMWVSGGALTVLLVVWFTQRDDALNGTLSGGTFNNGPYQLGAALLVVGFLVGSVLYSSKD